MKNQNKLILYALLLGSLFTFLFYKKEIGISFPIFTLAVSVFIAFILKENSLIIVKKAWLILIPIMLLSLRFFISRNSFFDVLNLPVIVVLFGAMTVFLMKGKMNWASVGFLDNLLIVILFPVKHFHRPYKCLFSFAGQRKQKKPYSHIKKVLLGLCISLPFLGIIIALLCSADMVFNNALSILPSILHNFLNNVVFIDVLLIIFITLAVFTYSFSFGFNLNTEYSNQGIEGNLLLSKSPRKYLDHTVLITILILINFVYILFSIIQFSYLFCGSANNLPGNRSYADYARHGFFELLAVSIINFSLILFTIFFTDKKLKLSSTFIKVLLFFIAFFTFIMLYSSYFRMRLYEQEYGYTYLRIFVYFFLLLESVLLFLTLVYIIKPRFSLLKACIITSLIFYIGLNYFNLDEVIARENIDRFYSTGKIDLNYLKSLSYDAVPQLSRLLDSQNTIISGDTSKYFNELKQELEKPHSWQEFNWSEYKAKDLVKS